MEVPFSHITSLYVRESVEGGPSGPYHVGYSYVTFALSMRVAGHKEAFTIARQTARKRVERIEAAIRDITGVTREKETEQELWWIGMGMRKKVLEKPGISHTELLRSVEGNHDLKESAIRQLLDQGELKSEQRGRRRNYFAS